MTNNMKSEKFTITIEGNIGSGKSTLLEALRDNDNVTVLLEPIQKWQDMNGTNLFKLMTKEPKRWANVFQTYVLITMLEQHALSVGTPIKILERSVFSAQHCFMKLLSENAIVHPVELAIHEQWIDFAKKNQLVKVDMGIYIRTSPEIALQRVRSRGRMEEGSITLEYLHQLHVKHEEWLMSSAWRDSFDDLQIINGDGGPESVLNQYKTIEEKIKQRW